MQLFHGSRSKFTAHVGICLTDDRSAAADYAQGMGACGDVTTVNLSFAGLRVLKARRFDEGSRDACGDTTAEIAALQKRRVDVVEFEDEAPGGRRHMTWRVITKKALKALTVG